MQTLTLDQLPAPVLLVWGLPEGSINPVASMGYLIAKVPNLANYCHVDTMADPVKLQKWLDTHKDEDDYKQEIWKIPEGEWKLIGKLSELTEERVKGLVENIEIPFAPDEICYPYYNMTGFRGLDSALESFRSAILNEGYYVINPFQPPIESDYMPNDNFTRKQQDAYWKDCKKYESAQSKTLPGNTLIFKRV